MANTAGDGSVDRGRAVRARSLLRALALALLSARCVTDTLPGPRHNCAELGYACGTDDFGRSCGTCPTGQGCNAATEPCPAAQGCAGGRCSACSCTGRECGGDTCGAGSCGTCGAGQECSSGVCVPVGRSLHNLILDGASPSFSGYFGAPFTIPVNAEVSYSTIAVGDGVSLGTAIFDPTNWDIYRSGRSGARAYAVHPSDASTSQSTVLRAGMYYLGVRCLTEGRPCAVSYSVSASY